MLPPVSPEGSCGATGPHHDHDFTIFASSDGSRIGTWHCNGVCGPRLPYDPDRFDVV